MLTCDGDVSYVCVKDAPCPSPCRCPLLPLTHLHCHLSANLELSSVKDLALNVHDTENTTTNEQTEIEIKMLC